MLSAFRLIFLCSLIGFVKADSIMQQTIKAFAEFHSVKCHILLFTYSNRFYEQRVSLDFYKAVIKNNYIPTLLENINNENKRNNTVSTAMQCSKPLRSFIMGNVSYIANYMIAEKRKRDIRKDVWLLFVTSDYDQELIISQIELSMRSEVYIARRTDYEYKFWEIYQPVKNNPIRIIYYGDWNAKTGLRATGMTVLERRRDFGGVVLRAAEFKLSEWHTIQNKYHAKLLKIVSNLLQNELNFTTKAVVVLKNNSDYQHPENPQNIIIRMLARNEAEISMVGLPLESASLSIIDYSGPVVQTNYRVYMKKRGLEMETGSHFFDPLPNGAWYTVISTATVIPVLIIFMHYIGRKAGLIRTRLNIMDLCITMHQMLCLQGGASHRELYSIGLVFVCFNLWAFLLRAMYSASLASSLAIEQYAAPFHSLEELLENGQYKFGVHRYSSTFEVYYNTDNLFLKKLNKAVMDQNISNLPKTYLEGLQRVCDAEKYAFMINRMKVLELQSKISCKLDFLPNEKYTVSTSYAMSKHNEYLPFINRWLHWFNEAGLMAKLIHDILGSERFDIIDDSQSFKSLKFEDTIFLQLLVLVGVILSIVILFAEILYSRMRRNRRTDYG